jgi:hypothetical protein
MKYIPAGTAFAPRFALTLPPLILAREEATVTPLALIRETVPLAILDVVFQFTPTLPLV